MEPWATTSLQMHGLLLHLGFLCAGRFWEPDGSWIHALHEA